MSGDLADPGLLAEVAVAAEQAGWDGVFVWDHLWNRTLVPFADPFVTLALLPDPYKKTLQKTKTVKNTLNPVWNEDFSFDMSPEDLEVSRLVLTVFDWDMVGSNDVIGSDTKAIGHSLQPAVLPACSNRSEFRGGQSSVLTEISGVWEWSSHGRTDQQINETVSRNSFRSRPVPWHGPRVRFPRGRRQLAMRLSFLPLSTRLG